MSMFDGLNRSAPFAHDFIPDNYSTPTALGTIDGNCWMDSDGTMRHVEGCEGHDA